MRERPVLYDTRGIWKVQPAYEGWAPKDSSRLCGHVMAALLGAVFASICVAAGL